MYIFLDAPYRLLKIGRIDRSSPLLPPSLYKAKSPYSISKMLQQTFPQSFQCYKPRSHKVFGTICMSPQNTILIVKGRATGKWSFPKGHKFRNEAYQDCARRETLEETGIDLSPYRPVAFRRLSYGEYYFYELPKEIPPIPNDIGEVEDARWMSLTDINRNSVNADVNYFIDRLLGGRGRKEERIQAKTQLQSQIQAEPSTLEDNEAAAPTKPEPKVKLD